MSAKRHATLFAAALAALGATAACQRRGGGAPSSGAAVKPSAFTLPAEQRARIHTTKVERAPFRRVVHATGTVTFDQNLATQVISAISGPVARLLVSPGDRVPRGAALAEVSSPDFAAAVSAYRKAIANAANLRRIAELDKKLFASGGIARRDMEQAETDAVSAETDRDAALAQLRALGLPAPTIRDIAAGKPVPQAFGIIRAPIPGVVVERLISPGQLLQAGTTPCFTIADLSRMWVLANVFPADMGAVSRGEPAEIAAGAGEVAIRGTVDYVGEEVDPNTRAVAVRISAPNPGGMLKNNAYVRVAISSSRPSVGLLVPVSAVLLDAENLPFVFVADGNGAYLRRRVTLGARAGDRYPVTAGLREGDEIVVEGGLFLQFAENQ